MGQVDAVAVRLIEHQVRRAVVARDRHEGDVQAELRQRHGLVRALPAQQLTAQPDRHRRPRFGHPLDDQDDVAGELTDDGDAARARHGGRLPLVVDRRQRGT